MTEARCCRQWLLRSAGFSEAILPVSGSSQKSMVAQVWAQVEARIADNDEDDRTDVVVRVHEAGPATAGTREVAFAGGVST